MAAVTSRFKKRLVPRFFRTELWADIFYLMVLSADSGKFLASLT
jgi:hypothetical protein